MNTPTDTITGQEKLAGALASFIFFIPVLMDTKSPFVVRYMKQGFIINIFEICIAILGSFLWLLLGIIGLLNVICVIVSFFLALQAFSGKEYTIDFLYTNSEKIINTLGITSIFTSGK